MIGRGRAFFKRETVLCVSAICALATLVAVPPDAAYGGYFNLRVLCLLWCLMGVVAGLQSCGAFEALAGLLLRRCRSPSRLGLVLVLLPFFAAMAVTNDVALLAFVPFTLLLLEHMDSREAAVRVVVLQTLAANLGSMATPVGNPQNLFLYEKYGLTAAQFFSAMLPLTALSLAALAAAALRALPKTPSAGPGAGMETRVQNPRKLAIYAGLFLLCLLTVFRVLPYGIMTALVFFGLLAVEPKLLKRLDYALLVTFVCFFVVSGNLGRLPQVHQAAQNLLSRSALLTAVLTSQAISNVPAAVLLSGFTGEWRGLLWGVNIGGLGTPIASLASLISLKFYLRTPGARPGRYLLAFTLANLAGLAVLIPAAVLLSRLF